MVDELPAEPSYVGKAAGSPGGATFMSQNEPGVKPRVKPLAARGCPASAELGGLTTVTRDPEVDQPLRIFRPPWIDVPLGGFISLPTVDTLPWRLLRYAASV